MTLGRNASVTIVSSMPWRLTRSTMYSMHGLLHTDTIGLGWLLVRGRRRVPSPPAMITACIEPPSVERRDAAAWRQWYQKGRRPRRAGARCRQAWASGGRPRRHSPYSRRAYIAPAHRYIAAPTPYTIQPLSLIHI